MVSILFKTRSFIIKCQVGAKCECQSAQQGELLCRWGSCQGKISRIGWAKRRQTAEGSNGKFLCKNSGAGLELEQR